MKVHNFHNPTYVLRQKFRKSLSGSLKSLFLCRHEFPNCVLHQHLLCDRRMSDGVKLFGRVFACVFHQNVVSSRMLVQERRHVVNGAMDCNPARCRCLVLGKLGRLNVSLLVHLRKKLSKTCGNTSSTSRPSMRGKARTNHKTNKKTENKEKKDPHFQNGKSLFTFSSNFVLLQALPNNLLSPFSSLPRSCFSRTLPSEPFPTMPMQISFPTARLRQQELPM
jgi:hypothetical protein